MPSSSGDDGGDHLYSLYFVVGADEVSSVEKYILAEPKILLVYPLDEKPTPKLETGIWHGT